MNMHGVMVPQTDAEVYERRAFVAAAHDWLYRRRVFLLIVVVPTLLTALYYLLVASNQYESEAHFIVRTTNPTPATGTGISQALSAATGLSGAQSESQSVADYLSSHDVVDSLQSKMGLVARFQRPGTDPLSRLQGDPPTPERLLTYYQDHVDVRYNTETGITSLKVRTFAPEDSYALIQQLLALGEARVNLLNERGYRDTLAQAQSQLAETESALARAQGQMTRYRQTKRDVDPQVSGQTQIELTSQLSAQLAGARALLTSMRRSVSVESPQYVTQAARVHALEAQYGAQAGRLTGGSGTIAADIGGYEDLRMRQQFLAKRYDAASANLDKAREVAQRQQLYVIRVVEPNRPVKSTYPKRLRIVVTTLVALLLAYGIGWLIVAGVREHSA